MCQMTHRVRVLWFSSKMSLKILMCVESVWIMEALYSSSIHEFSRGMCIRRWGLVGGRSPGLNLEDCILALNSPSPLPLPSLTPSLSPLWLPWVEHLFLCHALLLSVSALEQATTDWNNDPKHGLKIWPSFTLWVSGILSSDGKVTKT